MSTAQESQSNPRQKAQRLSRAFAYVFRAWVDAGWPEAGRATVDAARAAWLRANAEALADCTIPPTASTENSSKTRKQRWSELQKLAKLGITPQPGRTPQELLRKARSERDRAKRSSSKGKQGQKPQRGRR